VRPDIAALGFLFPLVYWAIPGGKPPDSLEGALAVGAVFALVGVAAGWYKIRKRSE
jgi:hypothetical protein